MRSLKFGRLVGFYKPLTLRCTLGVVLVFITGLVLGHRLAPNRGNDWGPDMLNFRDKSFVPVQSSLTERHQKFVKYVVHNTKVIGVALCIGPLIFFYPLIRAGCLGGIIGVALWNLGSPSLWTRFFLPHSLVELPLTLYVDAVAMQGGLRWLAGGVEGRWNILKLEWVANLKLFLLLIPLILLAAGLEAYITNR